MSWVQVATAALGGGGGGGGVTLNLNELVNPLGEHWYNVMIDSVQTEMPAAASAYPSQWDESTFKQVVEASDVAKGWVQPPLQWHMAEDTWWPNDELNWSLIVHWEYVWLPPSAEAAALGVPDEGLWLIDHAQPLVEIDSRGDGFGWKLNIESRFDQPSMRGNVAYIPVSFHITVGQEGDLIRECTRWFEIRGDSTSEVLQGA